MTQVFEILAALWSLGVLFSLVAALFDDRLRSPRSCQAALAEAVIWFLVLVPWREWLPSTKPGSHRRVTA